MAPVPKRKHTNARTGKREFGKKFQANLSGWTKCPSCGKLRQSHRACENCGYTYTK